MLVSFIEKMLSTNLNKYVKIIEWTLFFSLCGLSAVFMWEVLCKFISGKTGFTQSEGPILESPTLTLCFSLPETRNTTFMYQTDFKIKYIIVDQSIDRVQSILLKEGHISPEVNFTPKKITCSPNCYFLTSHIMGVLKS